MCFSFQRCPHNGYDFQLLKIASWKLKLASSSILGTRLDYLGSYFGVILCIGKSSSPSVKVFLALLDMCLMLLDMCLMCLNHNRYVGIVKIASWKLLALKTCCLIVFSAVRDLSCIKTNKSHIKIIRPGHARTVNMATTKQ